MKENGERRDFVGVGFHELLKGIEVILSVVELTVAFELLRGNGVLVFDGREEGAFGEGIITSNA